MKRNLRSQADYQSVMLRNQLTSLVLFESVKTTEAKAKPLLAFANHFFNRVKEGSMTDKRFAHQTLLDKNAAKKVFEEILPRFKSDETTFIREYKTMPRRGDNAPQTLLTFIRQLEVKTSKPESKEIKAKVKKAA